MLVNKEILTDKLGSLRKLIWYEFYQKPMANRVTNRKQSTEPENHKVSTITQEITRDLPLHRLEDIFKNTLTFWHRECIPSG